MILKNKNSIYKLKEISNLHQVHNIKGVSNYDEIRNFKKLKNYYLNVKYENISESLIKKIETLKP